MNCKTNDLRDFYLLWCSQSLSQIGSATTGFALTLWLYERTGSALGTASLTICSYAPYVLVSVFAGALTDRLNKKATILTCDALAALGTITVLALLQARCLAAWHLYVINAFAGLMSSVQEPAAEVACTLVVPKEHYQRASSLQNLTRSVLSIGTPLIASTLYGTAGLEAAIALDLATFAVAFLILASVIVIPELPSEASSGEGLLSLVREGIGCLREQPLVFDLILFMAGVNFVATAFDAVLPALIIPNPRGGNEVLGIVNACAGVAMVAGSILTTALPEPRNRVRTVYLSMFVSLGIENFLLAFSREPVVWCVGQVIGWTLVPVMSVNLDVIMRTAIPVELQGRIFACRNSLQYFTVPLGLLWGGFMVDEVCEPLMASHGAVGLLARLFGTGKGSGAALMMCVLGMVGIAWCTSFGRRLRGQQLVDD